MAVREGCLSLCVMSKVQTTEPCGRSRERTPTVSGPLTTCTAQDNHKHACIHAHGEKMLFFSTFKHLGVMTNMIFSLNYHLI